MGKQKAWLCLAIMLCSVLNCTMSTQAAVCKEQGIEAQLIRLHVLANSETLADQRVKLAVRDQLLTEITLLLQTAGSVLEAEKIIKENLHSLTISSEAVLQTAGMAYGARIQFGKFNFPDKYYGQYTLPAGRYTALNVTLGEGAGRNWWCIVFPAMCYTAGVCQAASEQTPENQVYHVRSKVVEWVGHLFAWCKQLLA